MRNNIKKFILCFSAIFLLFTPAFASAQSNEEDSSTDDIPVYLQVPLPFVGDNPDLSDYLKGVYRLLIGAGILFAVVMIIIAGYQWIFAGGSADKIGNAKKRIFSAVIGLILALLSYVILNAITPRLVAMRMPEVEAVPSIYLTGKLQCTDKAVEEIIANKYGDDGFVQGKGIFAKINIETGQATEEKLDFSQAPETQCGYNYRIGEGRDVCSGVLCSDENGDPSSDICIDGKCESVSFYGNINWEKFSNAYVDNIIVRHMCNEEKWYEWTSENTKMAEKDVTKLRAYKFSLNDVFRRLGHNSTFKKKEEIIKEWKTYCSRRGGLKGFILEVEVNDDASFGPTLDDDFAVGKSSSGADKCAGGPISTTKEDGTKEYDYDDLDWSSVTKGDLFQPEDFLYGAVQCNINISRNMFPAR